MSAVVKKWETIGTVSEIPDPAVARARARDILISERDRKPGAARPPREDQDRGHGMYPANDLTSSRDATDDRVIREEKQATASNTFEALVPEYLAYCGTKRKRKGANKPETIYEKEITLNKHVMSLWRDREVSSIKRTEIDGLLASLEHSLGAQYRVYAILGHFFSWALQREYVAKHPMAGMGSPYEYTPRNRFLSPDEIRWFWWACEDIGWPHGTWAKTLLLTAQRCNEVGKMVRSEIDEHYVIEAGDTVRSATEEYHVWRIPKERTKSKREHVVPLSELAREVLNEAPNLTDNADRFFIGQSNTVSVKKRIHALMLKYKRQELGKRGEVDDGHLTIKPWVFHDLRRTAATVMAKLGHSKDVVHKIMNHSDGGRAGVGLLDSVYVIWDFVPMRARALEDLANYVLRVVTETPGCGK